MTLNMSDAPFSAANVLKLVNEERAKALSVRDTGVDFLFRTSFFMEQLEFNLSFGYQRGEIHFENI